MPVPILQQIPVFAKAPFAIYRLMDRDTLESPIPGGFFDFHHVERLVRRHNALSALPTASIHFSPRRDCGSPSTS
jgi:hypothetical protein